MKQRIRVAGIIRNERSVLIMKKAQGRVEGAPVWEIPTGKIGFGEQPEEALNRMLGEYLGVEVVEKVELKDVITFMAPQGASRLSNLYIIYDITLQPETKITPQERYTTYKFIKMNELSGYHLDEASLVALEIEGNDGKQTNYKNVANSATVYVDGCSRGNPGPAGIGYHIVGTNGAVLASGGEFIGFATSRVAEYYALKLGCEKAMELGLKTVRFVGDNLMMINQMNGVYKVKNQDVLAIYREVKKLTEGFEACAFTHVAREQNTKADAQANAAVDAYFSKG